MRDEISSSSRFTLIVATVAAILQAVRALAHSPRKKSPNGLSDRRLGQFVDRILDGVIHQLPVGNRISHDGLPLKAYVGRPVLALEDQRLQAPLVAERIVGGIAKKVAHPFLPYSGLDSLDDRRHASVKLPRHLHGQWILLDYGRWRSHGNSVWPFNQDVTMTIVPNEGGTRKDGAGSPIA